MDGDYICHSPRKIRLMQHVSASLHKQPLAVFTEDHKDADRIQAVARTLEDKVQAYMIANSKTECMTLLEILQRKLPRELRDMVYAFLLPHQEYKAQLSLLWLWKLGKIDCRHLFNHQYVPFGTMKEIGEMWYEVSTFIVLGFPLGQYHNPTDPSTTVDFLDKDGWNLDIDVCQHVNHVCVSFDYTNHDDDNITQLRADLQQLLPLKPKARVDLQLSLEIYFDSNTYRYSLDKFVAKFSMVFLVLEKLVREGKFVRVRAAKSYTFDVKVEELNVECWVNELRKMSP